MANTKFYFTHAGETAEVSAEQFCEFVKAYDCYGLVDCATFDGMGAVLDTKVYGRFTYCDHNIENFRQLSDMPCIEADMIKDVIRIDFSDEILEYDVISWTQYEVDSEDDESLDEPIQVVEAYVAWDKGRKVE